MSLGEINVLLKNGKIFRGLFIKSLKRKVKLHDQHSSKGITHKKNKNILDVKLDEYAVFN